MKRSRLIGPTSVAIAALVVSSIYMSHPAKSSDHQDTFNLATKVGHNTTADITDVYVFPAPDNANNVVLAMDTAPLTPSGMGTSVQFDPTLLYQFKISHQASGQEDQVIQFTVDPASATGTAQTLDVYGPAAPNEAAGSLVNTTVAKSATVTYGVVANPTINGAAASVYAGPAADPFNFDLFGFFTFLGDRNYGTHTSQSDPGPNANGPLYNGDSAANVAPLTPSYDKSQPATTPSFNGFKSGTMSNSSLPSGGKSPLGNYACATNPASNTLTSFNVESLVIEVPKSLLIVNGVSTIHVWATTSSSTQTS